MSFRKSVAPPASTSNPKNKGNDPRLQVSDSLFKLFLPVGDPELDIIFFHGLQLKDYADAWWNDWSNDDGKSVWPETLLSTKFPQARMLSVSYEAEKTAEVSGRIDLFTVGEIMVKNIIENDKVAAGRLRPVVLIGHCVGGLVIKNFLMSARDRRKDIEKTNPPNAAKIYQFIENLVCIVYYATPNTSSGLIDMELWNPSDPKDGSVFRLFTTLNSETARLNDDFRKWRDIHNKKAFVFIEGKKTKIGGKLVMVANEQVAKGDHDRFHKVEDSDHITVCKPKGEDADGFRELVRFIKDNLNSFHENAPRGTPTSEAATTQQQLSTLRL